MFKVLGVGNRALGSSHNGGPDKGALYCTGTLKKKEPQQGPYFREPFGVF